MVIDLEIPDTLWLSKVMLIVVCKKCHNSWVVHGNRELIIDPNKYVCLDCAGNISEKGAEENEQ